MTGPCGSCKRDSGGILDCTPCNPAVTDSVPVLVCPSAAPCFSPCPVSFLSLFCLFSVPLPSLFCLCLSVSLSSLSPVPVCRRGLFLILSTGLRKFPDTIRYERRTAFRQVILHHFVSHGLWSLRKRVGIYWMMLLIRLAGLSGV